MGFSLLGYAPAGECEDAAQADGVFGAGAAALAAEAGEFDQHFGCVGGVAVAKMDEVVVTALKPSKCQFHY